MAGGFIARFLFRGLANALSVVQLVGGLDGYAEIRAIYIGREEVSDMFEVIMELQIEKALLERFIRAASSIDGFVEIAVEDLDARFSWAGLR